jgi:hypothetical protein
MTIKKRLTKLEKHARTAQQPVNVITIYSQTESGEEETVIHHSDGRIEVIPMGQGTGTQPTKIYLPDNGR